MMPMTPQPAGLPSGRIGARRRGATWADRAALGDAHRAPLLAGALLLGATALWWGVARVAQAAGVPLPWAVDAALAQALLAALGVPSLLAVGLLFGAGPQLLGLGAVPARLLSLPVSLMSGGWALALVGFHVSRALAGLGLAAAAVGLALAMGLHGLLVLESPRGQRRLGTLALAGGLASVVGQWAAALMVVLSRDALAAGLLSALVWVGPGLCGVALALGLASALRADAAAAGGSARSVGPLWRALQAAAAWLGVALLLQGVSLALMGASGGNLSADDAPRVALVEGALTGGLMALATWWSQRVDGQGMRADPWMPLVFAVLNVAVGLHLAAALWPALGWPVTLLAAQFWLAATGAWTLRHAARLSRGPKGPGRAR